MRYRADAAGAVRIAELDTLTALYHRRSGQTHLLAEPMPEILAVLEAGEADIPTILERLAIDDDADARAILGVHLDALIATGLVSAA